MNEFRDFIMEFVFYPDNVKHYEGISLSDRKYMRKYKKKCDEIEQNKMYDSYAELFYLEHQKEMSVFLSEGIKKIYLIIFFAIVVIIFLFLGLFIDSKVYDRNRNFRLIHSSK